ncbi:MAG: hypothetical protein QW700_04775 [Desulfurococcaceae archaeon]
MLRIAGPPRSEPGFSGLGGWGSFRSVSSVHAGLETGYIWRTLWESDRIRVGGLLLVLSARV